MSRTDAVLDPPRAARPAGQRHRLVVLTRDCVFSDAVLARLAASEAVEVVGLVRSTRPFRRARGPLATLAAFVRRCGPRYTRFLVATSVPVPLVAGWRPLRAWSRRLAVPLAVTADVNGAAARAFIEACAPDILLTVEFNQILAPPLIETPRWRAFNIHPSLLPTHRGLDPVLHGLLAGDALFGVTVHRLAAEVDRGEILARRVVDIAGQPLTAAYLDLFRAGAEAFLEAVAQDPDALLQQPPGGNANRYPTPAEVAGFLAAGHRF